MANDPHFGPPISLLGVLSLVWLYLCKTSFIFPLIFQAIVARANCLKNSGVPDDIFQLDDLSVLVSVVCFSL